MLAQVIKLRKPCPQALEQRVPGRGLIQKALNPGGSADRAPDGKEVLREKTGPFGPGAGKKGTHFKGSLQGKGPLFLQDP